MPTSTQTKTTRPRASRLCLVSLAVLCALALTAAGCGGGGAKENSPFLAHNETTGSNPFTTPSNLFVLEKEVGKYTLNWDPVTGADHYEITVSGAGEGYVVTSTSSTYVDTNVSATPTMRIKAYAISACKGTICSWKSKDMTFLNYPLIATPQDSGDLASAGLSLQWGKVPDATSYTVYRSCGTPEETSFSTSVESLVDSGLAPETYYKYCISSCIEATCTVKSPPTVSVRTGKVYEIPATPVPVSAEVESPFVVTVSFGTVATAESYNIYVTESGGAETTVTTMSSPYQLTGLKMNKKYTLSVAACNTRTCSARSVPFDVTTKLTQNITVDSTASTAYLANAVPVGITATGSYSVSYSSGAVKNNSTSNLLAEYFSGAVIYSNSVEPGVDRITLASILAGTPSTLAIKATDSLAIMVEAESTSDNSDFSVLTFSQVGKTPLNVALAGFGNSVQLTSSNSRVITNTELPAGTYKVSITADSMPISRDGARIFDQVLIYYVDTSGLGIVEALPYGGNLTFTKDNGSIYAFFVDDNPSTVSGSLDLVFSAP